MADATCGICLDDFTDPVSTPCGHLHCEKCLIAHIEASADAIQASCPACRAKFAIASPDLRFVPQKYHRFIIPAVRRVYFTSAGRTVAQQAIATLEERIATLTRDKLMLMDRCEANMVASTTHAQGERDARMKAERLRAEMTTLRKKYEALKEKYRTVKTTKEKDGETASATKRTSSEASLDVSGPLSASSSTLLTLPSHQASTRTILRIPKRPRLTDVLQSPFDPAKYTSSSGHGGLEPPPTFKKRFEFPTLELDVKEYDEDSRSGLSRKRVSRRKERSMSTSSDGPGHGGDLFSPSTVASSSAGLDSEGGGHGSLNYGLYGFEDDDD